MQTTLEFPRRQPAAPQTHEYKAAMNRKHRRIPKPCECGAMGVKRAGDGWACQKCVDLDAARNAAPARQDYCGQRQAASESTGERVAGMWESSRLQLGDSLRALEEKLRRCHQELTLGL